MSDISDRIATDALKPQSTSADGVSVSRRSLSDMIAADRYRRDAVAADDTSGKFPLRVFQVVPSGGPR